jgi:hypothetical protein
MKITAKHLLLSTCFGLASVWSPQADAVNLITNGSFTNTASNLTNIQIGSNGGFTGGFVDGWVSGTVATPLTANLNYNFIVGAGTSSSSIDKTGALTKYGSQLYLYGTNNVVPALGTPATGLQTIPDSSPDGGNYLALDGAFEVGPLSQQLSGLTIGNTYDLSFYMAAGQQSGYEAPGGLTEKLDVTLGGQTLSTPVITFANHGFVDWSLIKLTFTADSVNPILSFLSVGTPDGQPPFALLDGVSLEAVPEPSTCLIGTMLFGGLAFRRNRRNDRA